MSFGHTFVSLFVGCYVHVGKLYVLYNLVNSDAVFRVHFLMCPFAMLQKVHSSCFEGCVLAIDSLLDAIFTNKDVQPS
jgi:hypothetical protein